MYMHLEKCGFVTLAIDHNKVDSLCKQSEVLLLFFQRADTQIFTKLKTK